MLFSYQNFGAVIQDNLTQLYNHSNKNPKFYQDTESLQVVQDRAADSNGSNYTLEFKGLHGGKFGLKYADKVHISGEMYGTEVDETILLSSDQDLEPVLKFISRKEDLVY
jgi:hypothetical protein